MKYLLLLTFTFIGCASKANWVPTGITQTNVYQAHNDCWVKSRVALGGAPGGLIGNHFYMKNLNNFMGECMAGQGYKDINEN